MQLRQHLFKIIALLIVLGIGCAAFFLPIQNWGKNWPEKWIEQKISDALAQNTFLESSAKISKADFNHLYFDAIHLAKDGWTLDGTANITLNLLPLPHINAIFETLVFKISGITLNISNITSTLTFDPPSQSWRGPWHIDTITTNAGEIAVPMLAGDGKMVLSAEKITGNGNFKSRDGATHGAFDLNFPLDATLVIKEKAQLHLISAVIPWNKGTLSINNALIPLTGQNAMHATLNAERIPVDALMLMLTGKETLATGDVSGSVPLTIMPDGTIVVGQGKLQTEKAGIITLAPELIPGDNEQIALVRDIMKNLHYNLLSLSMASDAKHKLKVVMAVEGNNPDVAQGRPVKLTVNLTGDVLDMIQQSLLSLIDPKMYLKQDPHVK